MSADDLKRIRAQQEAQAMALQRMQMQMQAQNARRETTQDEYEEVPPQQFHHQPPPQYNHQPDHNQAMLQHIINEAGSRAAQEAMANMTAQQEAESKANKRMERLTQEFPAIQDEDSLLTLKSRETYARINQERQDLSMADKYELAIREAANLIGARPVNTQVEDLTHPDFVMPAGNNPAKSKRVSKSRLTPNIIANAQLLGINVDASTPEGKKNLAELSEYSSRFNADQDETMYRYK